MKNLKSLFIAILMALPMTFSYAQSKVAHIDTQQLISQMPEVVAAQKQLEELKKPTLIKLKVPTKNFKRKLNLILQMLQIKLM